MLITEQLMVAIDFHGIFPILWKSMAAVNCFVTNILQNILFLCSTEERNSHRFGTTWNNDRISFLVNHPFNKRFDNKLVEYWNTHEVYWYIHVILFLDS